uniref:Uncharacterized protein n=1 Tax=Rhizophora mucronata TaxID=61149 RepID=A0A2P2NLV8_RHIMU
MFLETCDKIFKCLIGRKRNKTCVPNSRKLDSLLQQAFSIDFLS